MLGWEFRGVGEALALVERPTPTPGVGEVVLEVKAAGLCHSDVGVLRDPGWSDVITRMPIIMGHEIAGVVAAVGPSTLGVAVGDRVGVCPLGPSGSEPGYNRDGGFATHAIVPAVDLVPIPPHVEYEDAAVGVDAGATSYRAVVTVGCVGPGTRVGIIGLGGLGHFGARIAVLTGADVFACDRSPRARSLAPQLGVQSVVATVPELAAFGLDVIIDFAGLGTTTADAMQAVSPGGRVVLVGMGALTATISTRELISRQVTLIGSLGATPEDVRVVYSHIATGDLTPEKEHIAFEEIPSGLERLAAGQVRGRLVARVDGFGTESWPT
jgi:propanol-preferring alcohol dehydrogenase